MSETKHTPEPWAVRTEGVLYITDGKNRIVATVASMLDGIDNGAREAETRSNARLIAAAPALFEALLPFAELGVNLNFAPCHQGMSPPMPPTECGRCKRVLVARDAMKLAEGQS